MFDGSDKKITNRGVGRPLKKSLDYKCDKRKLILRASRHLFLNMDYEKVSIRKIAKLSGVNPSLIAYYFIDKEGVYKDLLKGIVFEQEKQFLEVSESLKGRNMASLIDSHLEMMKQEPNIINLFFKVYFTKNKTERRVIIDYFIRPNDTFIKSKLADEKSKQDERFFCLMPGLIFTSALMQCLDKGNRDKIFPSDFENDLRRSIYSIDSDFLSESSDAFDKVTHTR